MEPLRIVLFGELRAVRAGREITNFETRKTGALLACLALFPNRPHPREVLAEQLWPDEDPEATRNRLRQALSTLRRILDQDGDSDSGVLLTGRNEARLNRDLVTVDVFEFEDALREASGTDNTEQRAQYLHEAIDIYAGELLPGFYEDWISAERERLAEVYRGALVRLSSALVDCGDFSGAIDYSKRAIACDPLNEDAHRELIHLLLRLGHQNEALRQYRELERVLRESLGTGPSPSIRDIFDQNKPPRKPEIDGPPSRRPSGCELEPEGGAVPLESTFYVIRAGDDLFQTAIARQDSIVLVKGARQIGKTSLLARGLQQAREAGKKVVSTDLQKLSPEQLDSAESLFRTLADMIVDQLDLDVALDGLWNPRRGWNVNFERFLRREVLGNIDSPFVWGLDEVDRLFGCPFSGVVFGLFRSWHNERSLNPDGPWGRLTLAIAYATEAHLFITDLNQSPFNVGTRVTLEDFTEGEVAWLNRRYDSPLKDGSELAQFYRLVGGHPYLVRSGLHAMSAEGLSIARLEAQADREDGIFGDHLRRMVGLLMQDEELRDAMFAVVKRQNCPTSESFYRLRSAGVITGSSTRDARARCSLYESYLIRRLM